MRDYELTERGKIVVVVIVALILIIIVSVILTVNAISDKPSDSIPTDESELSGTPPIEVTAPSDDKSSPPPSGGGFTPPETSETDAASTEDEVSESPASTDEPEITENPGAAQTPIVNLPSYETEPPEDNAVPPQHSPAYSTEPTGGANESPDDVGDPESTGAPMTDGNTLCFIFNLDSQDALDSEIISKLGEFLSLPTNKPNSVIAVETNTLPIESAQKLMSAVTRAFAAHGISDRNVSHVVRSVMETEGTIEVLLYFIPASEK